MVEHINQFNTLLEQLAAIGSTIQDEDTVITLLGSLPESSKSLVISLSMHPKLPLRKVASILLQEETRRKDLGLIAKKPIALFPSIKKNNFRRKIDDVQQQNKSASGNNTPLQSDSKPQKTKGGRNYCGKQGHYRKKCWQRIADERKAAEANVAIL